MRTQADLEGKSLYAVCSHGSFGPDLLLTRLSGTLITATAAAAWRYSPQSFAQSFVSSFTADLRPDSSSKYTYASCWQLLSFTTKAALISPTVQGGGKRRR